MTIVTFTSNDTSILLNDRVIATMPEAGMASDAAAKMNFLCSNGMFGPSALLNKMLSEDATLKYDGNIPQLATVSLIGGCGAELEFLSGISKDTKEITFQIGQVVNDKTFDMFIMDDKVFGQAFMAIHQLQVMGDDAFGSDFQEAGYAVLSALLERNMGADFKQLERKTLMSATACAYLHKDESGDDLDADAKVKVDEWKQDCEVHDWVMDEEDTSLRTCPVSGITDVMVIVTYYNHFVEETAEELGEKLKAACQVVNELTQQLIAKKSHEAFNSEKGNEFLQWEYHNNAEYANGLVDELVEFVSK